MPPMKRFGEKLRALRESHGLSYSQLAAQLGYHRGYLSNVELGNRIPSVEFVLQIAEHFDVSLDDLMRDERELRLKKR